MLTRILNEIFFQAVRAALLVIIFVGSFSLLCYAMCAILLAIDWIRG